MASIIIHTNSQKDLSLLQELAQKMGFTSEVLDDSSKEDFALAKAIQENDSNDQLKLEDAKAYYQSLNKAR